MFAVGELFLCKHLTSRKLQDRAQAADLELIGNFNFPCSASCNRCGNLQTVRMCIALKLQLFIRSNLFLKESQPVKGFCSRTTGDYLLLQFILSQPLLDCGFHLVFRKSTENPSNETNLWFSGKASHFWGINQLCHVSQLTDTITVFCLRLGKKNKWGEKKKKVSSSKFCHFSPERRMIDINLLIRSTLRKGRPFFQPSLSTLFLS